MFPPARPARTRNRFTGRMFQTPFADRIRNDVGIATMAVGNIFEVDHVNSILAARRADVCCLARPHLMDPNWTLRAAAQQRYQGDAVRIPVQYETGFEQARTQSSAGGGDGAQRLARSLGARDRAIRPRGSRRSPHPRRS